jgi:hypothetical protein
MKKLFALTLIPTLLATTVAHGAAVELKAGKAAAAVAQQARPAAAAEQKQFSAARYIKLPLEIREKVEGEINADKTQIQSILSLYKQEYTGPDATNIAICAAGHRAVIIEGYCIIHIIEHRFVDGTWGVIHTQDHNSTPITSVAMSLDGERVMAGSPLGTLFIMERQADKWVTSSVNLNERIGFISMNYEGDRAVISTMKQKKLHFLERQADGQWAIVHTEDFINVMRPAISGDGNHVVMQPLLGNVTYIMERQEGDRWTRTHTVIQPGITESLMINMSYDGNRIVTLTNEARTKNIVQILGRQPDNRLIVEHTEEHRDSVSPSVSINGRGNLAIITLRENKKIHYLNRQENGEWITAHTEHTQDQAFKVAASYNGNRIILITGTPDNQKVKIKKCSVWPHIIPMNATDTLYNILGLKAFTPAQYCLISELHEARKQQSNGVIILTRDQLGIFKTLPTALRMFIKHKYNLTTEAIAQVILDKRKDKKIEVKVAAHEEKKAGVPQQAPAPQPAAAATAKAAAGKSKK